MGGHPTAAQNTSGRSPLHSGTGGLTTRAGDDERMWVYFYVYLVYADDGTLSEYEVIVVATDETDYRLISSRGTWTRVVENAECRIYLSMPWSGIQASIRSFNFFKTMELRDRPVHGVLVRLVHARGFIRDRLGARAPEERLLSLPQLLGRDFTRPHQPRPPR